MSSHEYDISNIGEEDFAPGWRPKEGDKLVGRVLTLSRAWSKETNTFYPVVTILDEETNERVAIHCFHFSLDKKMKELKPKVGERIAVYRGAQVAIEGTTRTVVNYNVKVEGRQTEDIWGDDVQPKEKKEEPNPEIDTGEPPW